MIQHASFRHGWFYHYRVHLLKSQKLLTNVPALKKFLNENFSSCPHDYFQSGPRGSAIKLDLGISPVKIEGHEISQLASIAPENYKTSHSNVEIFLLENDPHTIAVEVPLWLLPEEIENYERTFQSNEPLTGHADIIRIEDNKIWVWDYKPNANKEKYASAQVFFYALMLSKRTGIPLSFFRCGYFDENQAYIFSPDKWQTFLQ
ncbi:MAG: PD-(D/E)XK nuclease family protein [Candidatus Woesearchaeota archaeon]